MAGIAQVNVSRVVQARLAAAHQATIASLCQVQVKFCQQFNVAPERIRLVANLEGELAQDTLDLLAFFNL